MAKRIYSYTRKKRAIFQQESNLAFIQYMLRIILAAIIQTVTSDSKESIGNQQKHRKL